MKISRGFLLALILNIIVACVQIGFSQEDKKEKATQEIAITNQQKPIEKDLKPKEEKKVEEEEFTSPKEIIQKYDYDVAKILSESQHNIDKSIDILNVVATLMGVLVGLLTLIVIIGGGLGIFEYSRIKKVRRNIEKEAKSFENTRRKAEEWLDDSKKQIEKTPAFSLIKEPSEQIKEQLDEFNRRLELYEILGLPLNADDYANRGYDLFNKNKFEDALRNFEEAIKLEPDNFRAWLGKGQALDKLDRYEEALKAGEKCIELKPEESFTWSNKGGSLINLKRYEEALEPIEKALGIMPINPHAWINKGTALLGLERYDESIEAYKKAIELKPDDALILYNLACIYSLKNDKTNSLSYLAKAVNLDKSIAERAKKDRDFEALWNDDDFKKIVS